MKGGFRVGRIFDIEIRIDWSWLLIFLLITWNLGTGFARVHAQWGASLIWAMALGASLLFFGSVLAHELAHSLMARARGIPVRRITLFLFGGVSNIEKEPASPESEFLITIVGPVTSFILGWIFIAISGVSLAPITGALGDPMEMISELSPLSTMLLWLGPVNLLLAVFNLLPGFPLDGGRVLRSILWAVTDDLRKATRWASQVGQGMAWLMIGAGIAMIFGIQIPILGTGFGSGLWLVFIGWFLHGASVASYRHVVVRDILEDFSVSQIMRTKAPTVSPEISIDQLVQEIMTSDDHAFPVLEGTQLVGLVTLEDMRSVPRASWSAKRVREIMTPTEKLISIGPDMEAAEALTVLTNNDVRQLPVLQEGRLVGLLRRRDIVRWLQLHSDSMLS